MKFRDIKIKLATEGTEITEFLKPKKYRDKCQVSKAIRLRRTKVAKRNFLYNKFNYRKSQVARARGENCIVAQRA